MTRRRRTLVWQAVGLALVLGGLVCWMRRSAWFSMNVELPAYDVVTRLCWPWKSGHPDVVLVGIRGDLAADIPLRDAALAEALEVLVSAEPSLVGVDLMRDRPVPKDDASGMPRLAAIGVDERVVWMMGEEMASTERFDPPEFMMEFRGGDRWLRNVASATYPQDKSWSGLIHRRGSAATWEGEFHFSLPAVLAWRHAGQGSMDEAVKAMARLDEVTMLPLSAGGYWLPDGSGGKGKPRAEFLIKPVREPRGRFVETTVAGFAQADTEGGRRMPVLSLADVLRHAGDKEALRRVFAGKVVLLGVDDRSEANDELAVVGDVALRGLKFHALATSQLLRELAGERPVGYLADGWEDAVVVALALLSVGMLAVPRLGQVGRMAGVLGVLPVVMLGAGVMALKYGGVWVPVAAPWVAGVGAGLGGMVLSWRASAREREEFLEVMRAHLGPEVTAKVLARNEVLTAGMTCVPESFVATAMFGDLRGYAAASQAFHDRHEVKEFFQWLNALLRPAVEITGEHQGFVKQFVGDEIYVIFGFPEEGDGGHAQRAVECALRLAALVPELNERLPEGMPRYHMRIGIYTGEVHASAVGGRKRADFSFLGPTINKAARLQALEKERFDPEAHPVRILIGEETRRMLRDPSLAVAYGEEAIKIDKRLDPERVCQVIPRKKGAQEGEGGAS